MLPNGTPFTLLIDQRDSKLLSDAVQKRMGEIVGFFCSRGLVRVAVICPNSVMSMQMNRLSAGTPAAKLAFALNGKDPKWEAVARAWLVDGVRPVGVSGAS